MASDFFKTAHGDISITNTASENNGVSTPFYQAPDIAAENKKRDEYFLVNLMSNPFTFALTALCFNLTYLFALRYPNLNLLEKGGLCLIDNYDLCANKTEVNTAISIKETLEAMTKQNPDYTKEEQAALQDALKDFFLRLEIVAQASELGHRVEVNPVTGDLHLYHQSTFYWLVESLLKATDGVIDVDYDGDPNDETGSTETTASDIYNDSVESGQDLAFFSREEQEISHYTGFPSVTLTITDNSLSQKQIMLRKINRSLRKTLPYPMQDLRKLLLNHNDVFIRPENRPFDLVLN